MTTRDKIKQIFCQHKDTRDIVRDRLGFTVLEQETICCRCGKSLAYWICGSYEYNSPLTFQELWWNLKPKFIKSKKNDTDDKLPF